MKELILNRLREASTWKAIFSILSGLGLFTLTDAQADAAAAMMIAVYTFLSLILPDKFGKKDEKPDNGPKD
ncbi:MAG TPA: hypothetical protein PLT63_03475 [Syntrophales bacterium]|nr:hypothetical protein [Syntrophales bacterium]